MPGIEPSDSFGSEVFRDHDDGFLLELFGGARMLEGTIVPGALSSLTSKVRTELVGDILREDIRSLRGWICHKEHPLIGDRACLRR